MLPSEVCGSEEESLKARDVRPNDGASVLVAENAGVVKRDLVAEADDGVGVAVRERSDVSYNKRTCGASYKRSAI